MSNVASIETARQERMSDDRPTLNEGYCRVVNALAEGLARTALTSIEHRVVWAVIRLTYGWQKGKDRIAASQNAKATGMTRQKCSSTLSGLIERSVVIREGGGMSPIKINTNTDDWQPREKHTKQPENPQLNRKSKNGSLNPITVHPINPITVHTKDTKDKLQNTACSSLQISESDNSDSTHPAKPDAAIQSKSGKKHGLEIDVELSSLMAEAIDSRLEQDAPANRNMVDWANCVRLMRERDNREPAAIRALFAWAHKDPFWSANILSPKKLREKWSALAAKRNSQRNGGGNEAHQSGSGKSGEKLTKQLTDLEYARENF